jgi:hypothetical protein
VSSPDINLAPGDTAPLTTFALKNPDGTAMDLTGATVLFWYQPMNASVAKASRAVTIVAPATDGNTLIDWLGTGGAIAPGNYLARYVVTFLDTHQVSVPDGPRAPGVDVLDPDQEFYWLRVASDFT